MLYCSNNPEQLCHKLAQNLRNNQKGVFDREIIVTQSAGMTSWLKTTLAYTNGVIANIVFLNQDAILSELYELMFEERLISNKNSIKFKIYKALGKNAFIEAFPLVSNYYKDDDLRQVQLAGKIADLFDQYQLYRSDLPRSWKQGTSITDKPDSEEWQKWLWNEINIESREEIKDKIIVSLEAKKSLVESRFPRISFFGITIFTEFHLDFFKTLSRYIQMDFYISIPGVSDNSVNGLLISFGQKAKELKEMLEEKFGKPEFDKVKYQGYGNIPDTSLVRVQNQILENTHHLEFIDDSSILINSCYTPARESECLYNYLLDLFVRDKSLKPGDILVMTTDIDKYAPYIKALFVHGPVKIPVWISGAASTTEDSILSAVEQILKFTEEDFTSEKVVSLLEQKRIKTRFGVRDCDYVRSVVLDANIRTGLEGKESNETIYVSWKYGLDKIILGYAMLTEEEYQVDDRPTVFPYRDAESSESFDLLKLKAFTDKLGEILSAEKTEKSLAEWKTFLFGEIIEEMIFYDSFSKEDRAELSSVYKSLSYIDSIDFEEKVSFRTFLNELDSRLFKEATEISLNTGNVTVSSPVPVRGIPFRVICFLGLDNDIFPRKDQYLGFDLMGEAYRQGDRSKKETDKYLFLDTILSAREKLYLSYIGQSSRDNSRIPPSVVIDTLVDYLDAESLVIKHPLHGFSNEYNPKAGDRMFTFLYGNESDKRNEKEPVKTDTGEISVYSFVKFFENPIQWYFEYILGIKYEEAEAALPESELFKLNSLDEWSLKQNLMEAGEFDNEEFLLRLKKEGKLPLKNLGIITLEKIRFEITELKQKYGELKNGAECRSHEVDLSLGSIRFTGTVNGIFGDRYIAYAFSDKPKYFVRAYLNALILYSLGIIKAADLIYLKKSNKKDAPPVVKEMSMDFIPEEEARNRLASLLEFFLKGQGEPLKFTPAAGKNILKGENTENVFLAEAEGNEYASMPPDKCIRNLYNEGYFSEFDIEDYRKQTFDRQVYEESRFDEIKKLASLLNITVDDHERE